MTVPEFPEVKILVFSMHNNPDYMIPSAKNGASGYLQKDTSRDEMLAAIRSIAGGELYFPPYTSSIIIRHLLNEGTNFNQLPSPVVEQIEGKSIWNIITPRKQQILKKANVKNTAELISLALKGMH